MMPLAVAPAGRLSRISGGAQASIEVDRPSLFGFAFNTQGRLYFFLLFFAVIAIIATLNLVRSRIGRAFVAVRDQDIAAEIIGINIYRYKLLAFAISSFYAGVCGVLYTYYFGIANYEQFQLNVSIVPEPGGPAATPVPTGKVELSPS